jgi:CheY-like chemotaxis protein
MIFQPFSQETRKSESGEHGVGLGLVITKELVGLMGGSIKVWSEPGKGSRFIVRLPLDEPVIPVPETANEEDSIRQKFRGRVLLAEDDETSGELGRMMMEQLGLQVDVAADGGRALEMALSETYDIIFMDCWMPVRSGINVAKELRSVQTGKNARVPIVALTANARKSDEVECLASGMNAFMLKPLMFANLVGMLCRFLPQDGQGTG